MKDAAATIFTLPLTIMQPVRRVSGLCRGLLAELRKSKMAREEMDGEGGTEPDWTGGQIQSGNWSELARAAAAAGPRLMLLLRRPSAVSTHHSHHRRAQTRRPFAAARKPTSS